jgi:hypothetical protein
MKMLSGTMFCNMTSAPLGGSGLDRCSTVRHTRDVRADARLEQVRKHQANHDRQTGDDEEIGQRLGPHAAEGLVVAAGNAQHHGAKDQGHDHHLHHPEEYVAQRPQHFGADPSLMRDMRVEIPANRDAKHQTDNNLAYQ